MGGTNRPNPCRNAEQASFISAPRDPKSKLPYPPWPNGTWIFEPIPGKPGFRTHPGGTELPPTRGCVNGTDTWGSQTPFPWPGGEGELGDGGKNETTTGHILSMLGVGFANITVGDVMDTAGGFLCYEYV